MSDDTLYLVKLDFNSENLGGGSMLLQLAVDPVHNTLTGRANGTINVGTQHPSTFQAGQLSGHMHSTGLGDITMVGAVGGQAAVSFPPPAIGTYLAPFTASFGVNGSWEGQGKFSIGPNTYDCQVSRVS